MKLHDLINQAADATLDAVDTGVERSYREFKILKKNGKTRTISAPHEKLKRAQKAIDLVLAQLDHERASEVGFKTNYTYSDAAGTLATKVDLKRAFIITVDLQDFFGSISEKRAARTLARAVDWGNAFKYISRAATYKGKLAQGSPCSPRIAGRAISTLDQQIEILVKQYAGAYARYADDLTIALPEKVGKEEAQRILGLIKKRILGQGITVAEKKIHLSTPRRKVVEIVGAKLHREDGTLRLSRKAKMKMRLFQHLAKFEALTPEKNEEGEQKQAKHVAAGMRANVILLARAKLKWSTAKGYTPPTRTGTGTFRQL